MLVHFGKMSSVVRHILPAFAPQFHGFAKPHSQIEYVIGFSSVLVYAAQPALASLRALPIRLY